MKLYFCSLANLVVGSNSSLAYPLDFLLLVFLFV